MSRRTEFFPHHGGSIVRAVLPIPLRSLDLVFDQRMRFWASFPFSEMSQIATHVLREGQKEILNSKN